MKALLGVTILTCATGLLLLQGLRAEPTSSDDPAIKRKFGALGMIWQDVQGQEPGTDNRKQLLTEFLDKSSSYLALVPADDTTAGQVWTFRALAACELDREDDAKSAGLHMQELGLDKSSAPLPTKALTYLERKGWLVNLKVVRAEEEAKKQQLAAQRKAEEDEIRRMTKWMDQEKVVEILARMKSKMKSLKAGSTDIKKVLSKTEISACYYSVVAIDVVDTKLVITELQQQANTGSPLGWLICEYSFFPGDIQIAPETDLSPPFGGIWPTGTVVRLIGNDKISCRFAVLHEGDKGTEQVAGFQSFLMNNLKQPNSKERLVLSEISDEDLQKVKGFYGGTTNTVNYACIPVGMEVSHEVWNSMTDLVNLCRDSR